MKVEASPTSTSPAKPKAYKLTPGLSPFPEWPHPTPEECDAVVKLLCIIHGKPERDPPTTKGSRTVAGCGKSPSVLDALMRTMLSAATNSSNSSRAFQNIVAKYGYLEDEGCVDWEAVRNGSTEELFETIKCGGLAQNKSRNMKMILDEVYEENSTSAETTQTPVKSELDAKISTPTPVISLQHLHDLPTDEAMTKLTSYPGVGVKTASCVLFFNFGRESFAVDTHIHRLTRWLGWIPNYASRDQAFSHLDARIPDGMKYDLHTLFWKHGKYCPKCRMTSADGATSNASFEAPEYVCPLEELIKTSGGRRVPSTGPRVKKGVAGSLAKGKKRKSEAEGSEDVVKKEDGESSMAEVAVKAVKRKIPKLELDDAIPKVEVEEEEVEGGRRKSTRSQKSG